MLSYGGLFVQEAAVWLAARGLAAQWAAGNAEELQLEMEALRQASGWNPPPAVALVNAVRRQSVQPAPAAAALVAQGLSVRMCQALCGSFPEVRPLGMAHLSDPNGGVAWWQGTAQVV